MKVKEEVDVKKLKITGIVFVVSWVISFLFVLIVMGDEWGFGEIISTATIFPAAVGASTLFALLGFKGPSAPPPSKDTGLMSCKKCGYLGVGSGGGCPRCGWTYTEKIKTDTTIISCPDCGYLGAGPDGACPRCGHTRAKKIK